MVNTPLLADGGTRQPVNRCLGTHLDDHSGQPRYIRWQTPEISDEHNLVAPRQVTTDICGKSFNNSDITFFFCYIEG